MSDKGKSMIFDWEAEGVFDDDWQFRQIETSRGPVFVTERVPSGGPLYGFPLSLIVDPLYGIPMMWSDSPTDPIEDFHKAVRQVEQEDEARLQRLMEEYNRCPQCGGQCVRAGGSDKHCPKCGYHEPCCDGAPQS